jgi:hypothetical protein
MALRIVGAGFGRTGTLSLKNALETLGFGPCYHMLEVHNHEGHVALWSAATDGEAIDWDALFSGYSSAVDWPACTFWRELAALYPDSKVLLSVRDPERWYDSVMNTIYQVMTRPVPETFPANFAAQRAMVRKLVLDRTFGGRIEDRAWAIDVYERHNRSVQDAVDADRLLVFEVAQGWKPLCEFLGCDVPDEPFPRVNDSDSFRKMVGLDDG